MTDPLPIWQRALTLDQLNRLRDNTMVEHLAIEFVDIGSQSLSARMPVDRRTHQPFGMLHGGASAALAETVASTAANLVLPAGHRALGLELNANHVRAVHKGWVTATASPLHLGSRTQVWQIHIDNEQQRLVCTARMTAAVLES